MDKFREYYFLIKTAQAFNGAKDRCENSRSQAFKRYGGRGIQCRITLEQVREIWKRDKAWELARPSLDRIDPNANYCMENCRFIENVENSRRANQKPVKQYDKGYNFIKEFPSIKKAADAVHTEPKDITLCCNLEVEFVGGYRWEWADPHAWDGFFR